MISTSTAAEVLTVLNHFRMENDLDRAAISKLLGELKKVEGNQSFRMTMAMLKMNWDSVICTRTTKR
jgi:hypothetical protein